MLFKNMLRQIRHSMGRYMAIFAIVALGVGFFVGLRVSKDAMVKTGENYFEELKLYDFRLVSTLGLTQDDVRAMSKLDEVDDVVGSVSLDVMYKKDNGSNGVLHVHSLLKDMNMPDIEKGRVPQNPDECIVDSKYYSDGMLDSYIELSADNSEDTLNSFKFDRYKVVGVASSPYYANFERGSSSLGGVSGFAYILPEGFDTDYYTEIFLRLDKHYEIYSDECDAYIEKCEEIIKPELEKRGEIRYESLKLEALEKIIEAEQELADGEIEYENSKADALQEIADAEQKIKDGEAELEKANQEINDGFDKIKDGQAELDEAKRELADGEEQLKNTKALLEEAYAKLDEMRPGMPSAMVVEQERTLRQQQRKLDEQEKILNTSREQINANGQMLINNINELIAARNELLGKYDELEDAKVTLEENRNKANEEFEKAEKELEDGRVKIADAKEKLEVLKSPTVFVLGRSTNVGYASLENDTDILSGIAKVFPLFFFVVAALVCVTTMTRMVDEQRVQNGVLKALGYSDKAIIGQYMFYAGSASAVGCVAGFLLGSKFMPLVLWEIYHIMYSINRPIVYLLDWKLFALCAAIFMFATLGSTWFAASGDLREAAAELIRPKAPAPGKRVFLERIEFIWKRIKFLHKVSIRNILRYKKRMFMMIIGVGGCTALLLTGFGIKDSIQPILDYQFGEIHTYDMVVSFLEEQTKENQEEFGACNSQYLEKVAFVHAEDMDLVTNGSSDSASVVVASNLDKSLVNLHNGDEEYNWPGKNETIIDYRLAKDNGISIGDTIEFRNSDYEVMSLKVVGIFDNYLRDYAYISEETYEEQLGKTAKINTAYANVKDGIDAGETASVLLGLDSVAAVNVTADQIEMVGNMLSSLDYVVLIVLVCAGALAFIVIYNLTNISINERIREIATIKVLGFHEGEAAAYVFRENLVLTVISSLVGLPMGVALHRYVMSQIRIKSMYFGHRILPMSFLWAVVITFAFAVFVDFFMYFRLKKINMAESLKAID